MEGSSEKGVVGVDGGEDVAVAWVVLLVVVVASVAGCTVGGGGGSISDRADCTDRW